MRSLHDLQQARLQAILPRHLVSGHRGRKMNASCIESAEGVDVLPDVLPFPVTFALLVLFQI